MKRLLIILLFALAICNTEIDEVMFEQFKKFIKKYNKKYNSVNEFLERFEVFQKNVRETLKETNDIPSFQTGITKFSDLTKEEFTKKYLNLNFDALSMGNYEPYIAKVSNAPPEFDWRDKGYVTPVKEQGDCGACWAFTTICNLEGQYFKGKGVLERFSEQFLVDCDNVNGGCKGGMMGDAVNWIKENGGLMKESDYPYVGYKGICKKDASKYVKMKVTGFKKLGPPGTWDPVDENEIKEFLYETGPLIAALNADPLKDYTGGIVDLSSRQCRPSGVNHGVNLVGYGHDPETGKDYWICKMAWGENWGENGYFRIKRGSGTCCINCYIGTATVSFD